MGPIFNFNSITIKLIEIFTKYFQLQLYFQLNYDIPRISILPNIFNYFQIFVKNFNFSKSEFVQHFGTFWFSKLFFLQPISTNVLRILNATKLPFVRNLVFPFAQPVIQGGK